MRAFMARSSAIACGLRTITTSFASSMRQAEVEYRDGGERRPDHSGRRRQVQRADTGQVQAHRRTGGEQHGHDDLQRPVRAVVGGEQVDEHSRVDQDGNADEPSDGVGVRRARQAGPSGHEHHRRAHQGEHPEGAKNQQSEARSGLGATRRSQTHDSRIAYRSHSLAESSIW